MRVDLLTRVGAKPRPPITLQALKNSLSPDQQSSILQGVLGKGGGTGKKTDQKLETPETVRRKNGGSDAIRKGYKNEKPPTAHVLRQSDEDPELRADDSVLIELIPLDELCTSSLQCGPDSNRNNRNRNNTMATQSSNCGIALTTASTALTAATALAGNGVD